MIDFLARNGQRDDDVSTIAGLVLEGQLDAALLAISTTAEKLGIGWRNIAGRVIRRIERMDRQVEATAAQWIQRMKDQGVNSRQSAAV